MAVLISGAAACGDDDGPFVPIDRLPRELTTAERAVVRNTNAFAFDLFRRVHAAEKGPNVLLSPFSASMALGMTLNGAADETFDAMRQALRFQGLSQQEINEAYRGLLDLLLDLDPRVELRIGNSVWARRGFPFVPEFFTAVKTYFDAEARELDFKDPRAADTINAWAKKQTNDRITKIVDRIEPENIMFLLNALYFKGRWTTQFDPKDTRERAFTRDDGSIVQVPMMEQREARFPVAAGEGFTAGELGYGGGAFAMTVILPDRGRSLDQVVAALDAEAWDGLVARLDTTRMDLRLPRFRFQYDELLNDPLMDMGMRVAFTDRANFTRLTPVATRLPVCIDFVRQKSFVQVNEEGTEAAAVTAVGISVTSLPPSFVVDRPFFFAIRERYSGTILFMGAIGDPTLTESDPAQSAPPGCESL